jgi:hypothetical protein
MQEVKIVLAQLGPLLLTVLGAISWTGAPGSRRVAIVLWAAALMSAGAVAAIEIKSYRHEVGERQRAVATRARLTPLIDQALSRGELLEYSVRDDKDREDEDAMYARHYAAFEQWRGEVHGFLTRELPGTVAANRFKTADGEYGVGKLGFELARLRRQRENLAQIYDNLDAYIARSSRGEPAAPTSAKERGRDSVRTVLLVLWLISAVPGFGLASYGVLRESFANLAQSRGYGEGRFGEGTYGGGPTTLEDRLIRLGVACRLLPPDRQLTVTDRKQNAAWAVTGVLLVGLSIVFDVVLKFIPNR